MPGQHFLENQLFGVINDQKLDNEQRLELAKGLIKKIIEKQNTQPPAPNLNAKDDQGQTFLTAAIKHFPEIVPDLIQAKADINLPNVPGESPLIMAAFYHRQKAAAALIEAGAKLDYECKGDSKESRPDDAFSVAVSARAWEIVSDLMKADQKNEIFSRHIRDGSCDIHSLMTQKLDLITELLERGAYRDDKRTEELRKVLIAADSNKNKDLVMRCLSVLCERGSMRHYASVLWKHLNNIQNTQKTLECFEQIYQDSRDVDLLYPIAKIEETLEKYSDAIRHCGLYIQDALNKKEYWKVHGVLTEFKTIYAKPEHKKEIEKIAASVVKLADFGNKQFFEMTEMVYPFVSPQDKQILDLEKLKRTIPDLVAKKDETGIAELIKLANESKDEDQKCELKKGIKRWAQIFSAEFKADGRPMSDVNKAGLSAAIQHSISSAEAALDKKDLLGMHAALTELKPLQGVIEDKKAIEAISEKIFKEVTKQKIAELLARPMQDKTGIVELIKLTDENKDEDLAVELQEGVKQWTRNFCDEHKDWNKAKFPADDHLDMLIEGEYKKNSATAKFINRNIEKYFDTEDSTADMKRFMVKVCIRQLRNLKINMVQERASNQYRELVNMSAVLRDEKYCSMPDKKEMVEIFNWNVNFFLKEGRILTHLNQSIAITIQAAEKKQDLSTKNADTIQLAGDNYPPAIYALANFHQRNNYHHYALVNYTNFLVLLSGLDNKKAAVAFRMTEEEVEKQRKTAQDYINDTASNIDSRHKVFAMWFSQCINQAAAKKLNLMESLEQVSVNDYMLSAINSANLSRSPLSRVDLKEYYTSEKRFDVAKIEIAELLKKPVHDTKSVVELIKFVDENKHEYLTDELQESVRRWARKFCDAIKDGHITSVNANEIILLLAKSEYKENSTAAKLINREIEKYFDANDSAVEMKRRAANIYTGHVLILGGLNNYKISQEKATAEYKVLVNMSAVLADEKYCASPNNKEMKETWSGNVKILLDIGLTHLNRSIAKTIQAAEKKQDLSTKNADTIQLARDNYAPAIHALAKYHQGQNQHQRALVQYTNFLVLLAGLDNKKAAVAFRVTEEEIAKQRKDANDYIQGLANDNNFEHRAFAQWLFDFINKVIIPGNFNLMESLNKTSVHDFMLSVFARWDAIEVCLGDQFPTSSLLSKEEQAKGLKEYVKKHYQTGLEQAFARAKKWRFALKLAEKIPDPKADISEQVYQSFIEAKCKKDALARQQLVADRKQSVVLERKQQPPAVVGMMAAQPVPVKVQVVVVQQEKISEPQLFYGEQAAEVYPVEIVGTSYKRIMTEINASAPRQVFPESAPMNLCGGSEKVVVKAATSAVVVKQDEAEEIRALMSTMLLPNAVLFPKKNPVVQAAAAPPRTVAPVSKMEMLLS